MCAGNAHETRARCGAEEAAEAVDVKIVKGDCPGHSGASKVLQTRAVDMQQLWQWASMIVSSRSFCLIDNEGNKYACLAPLAGVCARAFGVLE